MTSTLEILAKVVGELNERCADESGATGTSIYPFQLLFDGNQTCVKFLDWIVLEDEEINDGNDPDEEAWRKIIEDEAIDRLLAIRLMTIRDPKLDNPNP